MCDISLWTHSFTKVPKCQDVDTLSQSDAKTAATTSLHSEAGLDPVLRKGETQVTRTFWSSEVDTQRDSVELAKLFVLRGYRERVYLESRRRCPQ